MAWADMSPYAKSGIYFAIFIVLTLIIWGYMTDWHFVCYQRLPPSGQDWPK